MHLPRLFALTSLSLLAALSATGAITVSFSLTTTLSSGPDAGGFDGATIGFEALIDTETIYSDFGGNAFVQPDYVKITVSGASVSGNNGTFFSGEINTGVWRIFPNQAGLASPVAAGNGGAFEVNFGTTGTMEWLPTGTALANPSVGSTVMVSHFDGMTVTQPDTITITGSTYSIGDLAVSAVVIPEPSLFGALFGLGGLAFAVSRRRR